MGINKTDKMPTQKMIKYFTGESPKKTKKRKHLQDSEYDDSSSKKSLNMKRVRFEDTVTVNINKKEAKGKSMIKEGASSKISLVKNKKDSKSTILKKPAKEKKNLKSTAKKPKLLIDKAKDAKKTSLKTTTVKKEKQNIYELSKKKRKVFRKTSKDSFELATKAKSLWEVARRSDVAKEKNNDSIQQLFKTVQGKVKELVFAHDTSRVIECLMAEGTEEMRTAIFDETKDDILKLAKTKYSKFVVMKILKYGTKEQKNLVISKFYGHVISLMKHSEASGVVESAYNEVANGAQRAALTEEFYGPTFSLFKKEEKVALNELMETRDSKMILDHMKEKLLSLIDKPVIHHTLVHHVLNEYMTHCNFEDKQEIIKNVKTAAVQMLHSRDGSRVAMQCVWHGSAKDRKAIVKSFKTHITKICKEEHGHMVLLSIFDSVDDTQLVDKFINSEIITNLKEIMFDPHGRKVILYLLSPRNSVYCHPDVVRILELGDKNATSKKDKDKRSAELLEKISPPLLRFLAENLHEMIFTTSNTIVAKFILKYCIGNVAPIYDMIADMVAETFQPGMTSNDHIIEHTAGHLFVKHLIQHDKELTAKDTKTFCEFLIEKIPTTEYAKWIHCNRSAFVLVWMYETGNEDVMRNLSNILEPLVPKMKKSTLVGVKVLLKKLGHGE